MSECVRCGSNQNLINHDFTYDLLPVISKSRIWYGQYHFFRRRIIESLHSIPVSVCRSCKKVFDKWILVENVIFILGWIELVIFAFFGFMLLFYFGVSGAVGHQIPWIIHPIILTIIISVIFGLLLLTIIWYLIHRQKDTNPRRHIRIGTGVVPYVRPHNYPNWIDYNDWLNALEYKPVQSNGASIQKSDPYLKFEKIIYQMLKSNSGKAYTIKAILNRIIGQLSDESDKQFIRVNGEEILNEMSLKNQIKVVIKNGEGYYMIK
jgi:hypothetical protein